MPHTLHELAQRFSLGLKGDSKTRIHGLCSLNPGREGCLTYFTSPRLLEQLATTRAAAVMLTASAAEEFSGNALIASDPSLAFARIAALFDPYRDFPADAVHPTAVIAPGVRLGKGSCVGPYAVIAEGAEIGVDCFIGPHCVVGRGAKLGDGTRLVSQVFVWHGAHVGARCNFQPGAIIGARGFGNIPGPQGWEEVPQLGSVVIGDDVEIGANTCIDRGTLDDTVIETGAKIDNLVQIAHNVHIGQHTAIAACVGIAGSTHIGSRCMIGGAVGISGHLKVGDNVIIMAGAMVTKDLPGPGQYSGVIPAEPAPKWRKTVARLRRLEVLQARVAELEKKIGTPPIQDQGESRDDDP